jgi:hypothetical protein
MAHQYKVGDTVVLGKHKNRLHWVGQMDAFVGKTAILLSRHESYPGGWWVERKDHNTGNTFFWYEDVFTACPCIKVRNCLTHRTKT